MDYYHYVRREIQPLLPKSATRILEVGAGAGGTLKWLKTLYPKAQTTAVELNPDLREELKQNVDVAVIGQIDETFAELKTYDLILLLDVLEHLPELNWDPSEALEALGRWGSRYCFGPQYRPSECFGSAAAETALQLSRCRHPRSYPSKILCRGHCH